MSREEIYIDMDKLYKLKGSTYPDNVYVDVNFCKHYLTPEKIYKQMRPYLVKYTNEKDEEFLVLVFADSHRIALKFVANHYHSYTKIEIVKITNNWVVSSRFPYDKDGRIVKEEEKNAENSEN